MDVLIARIEQERGRRIKVIPVSDRLLGPTGLSGLWFWDEVLPLDVIFHPAERTLGHRQRIVLHELAHMWCRDDQTGEAQRLESVLPDFPPALLKRLTGGTGRVLTRHRYSTRTEMRAETIAGLLHWEAYAADTDAIETPTLRQLHETLRPRRRGRVGHA
ncbi:hypothetical protein [Streptomyces albus]|uniref:hypothetical protein n=1 Tax=Streptomyces sp. NRRL F-5917 TaxID=1463873 RepID=UPI0013316018|nr:hypothetical protein [Streptomyces sp. NRRL F-5917]